MAVKVFWVRPDGATFLPPKQVIVRLRKAFSYVSVDREAGRKLGEQFVDTYRSLLEASGDRNSTPLEVVERQWRDAAVVCVSDESDAIAPAEFVLRTADKLELRFALKSPLFQKEANCGENCHDFGIRH